MSRPIYLPYFPVAPAQYNPSYMNEVVRSFSVYLEQMKTPGPVLATTLTLNPSGQIIGSGELSYNGDEDTLNLTHLNGVIQEVGFETFMRVKNDTGSSIPKGRVVGFAGVNGEIRISPYIADGTVPELFFVGVTAFTMADDDVGALTVYGKVRGINTTGSSVSETWAAGDILYASTTTAGALTKVRPTAPNVVIAVAAVLVVDAVDGEIMVRPTIPLGLDYGTFSSNTDQTVATINTATAITYSTTEISNGVSIGSPTSRLVAAQAGYYQVAVSIQLTSSSGSAKNVYFWLDKNGTAVPDTTRAVTLSSNSQFFPFSTVYDVSLAASDYVRVMWAADSTDVTLDALAASAFAPAAPSVIVSVTQVQL
jgi:hypothetical protein